MSRTTKTLDEECSPHSYEIDPKNCFFLVINNETFQDNSINDRTGSTKDAQRLADTFENLRFKTRISTDLTINQMKTAILDACMQVQSNCQCFGLAILTHGGRTEKGEEVLYGTDGGYASLDELIQPLKKKKFGLFAPSHLVGKPKLVFVQECPGKISKVSADLSEDQIDGPHQALGRSVRSPGMHKDRFHDSTTSLQWGAATKRIPLARDLLIYYSSVPAEHAWKDGGSNGTIFIQTLCDAFDKNENDKLELISLLTRVNGRVTRIYGKNCKENCESAHDHLKYMPAIFSQLEKCVYLNGELVQTD